MSYKLFKFFKSLRLIDIGIEYEFLENKIYYYIIRKLLIWEKNWT